MTRDVMRSADPLVVRAATRGSALARWQTDHVGRLLHRAGVAVGRRIVVEPVVVETAGDLDLDSPLSEIGGKGVFVKEVQVAVLEGRADIAVHSGKDLPAIGPDGLVIASVPQRADPRDVLIGSTLANLVPGSTVATGSIRRQAQLAWARPDLAFVGLRGNIATRLDRIPDGGAIVMAVAAIVRLGIDLVEVEHEILSTGVMLPQVAQGALVIECRSGSGSDDVELRALLASIEHRSSRRAVDAERGFLAELGGDCDLPAGAYATVDEDTLTDGEPTIEIEGVLASRDAKVLVRSTAIGSVGSAPDQTGRALARDLVSRVPPDLDLRD